jgi:hypothetical protein
MRAFFLLVGGKFSRENRDEDDVVDAEDQFENGKRQQSDPGIRVSQPFHMAWVRNNLALSPVISFPVWH